VVQYRRDTQNRTAPMRQVSSRCFYLGCCCGPRPVIVKHFTARSTAPVMEATVLPWLDAALQQPCSTVTGMRTIHTGVGHRADHTPSLPRSRQVQSAAVSHLQVIRRGRQQAMAESSVDALLLHRICKV
jgi:hypothetical protein